MTNLDECRVMTVWKDGEGVARDGELLRPAPASTVAGAGDTVRVGPLTHETFEAAGPPTDVIEIVPDEILTVRGPGGPDALQLAVVERHRASGRVGLGWVRGLGPLEGTIASTVAHDSHNIIAAGSSPDDMLVAANALVDVGGGLAVASGGRVQSLLPLPVAGLMSDRPAAEVLAGERALHAAFRAAGGTLDHPFVALSFLALPVIPEIRLTDRGVLHVPA